MKAITVRQPWASAIASGAKTIENRTALYTYRGALAIHAGAGWSERGETDQRIAEWHGQRLGFDIACHPMRNPDYFPTAAILAVCELVDVHPDGGCCRPWGESSYREAGGRERQSITHLVLEDIRPLIVPVFATGRLGLWTVPEHVEAELQREVPA